MSFILMILGQLWLHPKYPWVSLQTYQPDSILLSVSGWGKCFMSGKLQTSTKLFWTIPTWLLAVSTLISFWDGKGRGGNCCRCPFTAKSVVCLPRESFCLEKSPFNMGTQHFTVLAEQPLLKDFFFFERWLCVTKNSFFNRPDDQSTKTKQNLFVSIFFFFFW